MKKRHTVKLNGIKGVDLTSHPAEVDKHRASYMINMISDGGVNRKRHGYRQLYEFYGETDKKEKINGIHKFVSKNGSERAIVHAGTSFYSESGVKIYSYPKITDTPSQLFNVDGISYIVGCGGIYTYDDSVIRYAPVYVPTVYRRYDHRLKEDEEHESPNLLTDRRICVYNGTPLEGDTYGVFELPSDMDLSKGATLYLEISHTKNVIHSVVGDSYDADNDIRIANSVTAIFELTKENTDLSREISSRPLTHNGRGAYIFDENRSPSCIDPKLILEWEGKRYFRFNFDASPEIDGDFNIRLEYCADYSDSIYTLRECAFGELIQDNRGKTRLVLSGNPNLPSGVYFSDSFDRQGASYFPLSCLITVDDGSAVTALMKLSDTYIGIFKKDRFFRYAFYFYPDAKSINERYYINGYEDRCRNGCINPLVCGKIGSDLLVFDGHGVYGIGEISSETDKSFSHLRSINIEKALNAHTDSERQNAVACMHDGRYMLFVGERVYIADTRYVFRDTERADCYQYEWWVWDCPRMRAALSIGGRLLMGDGDGGVFTLGGDYRDIRIVKRALDGDTLYLKDKGILVINSEIPIDNDTLALIKGYTSFLKNRDFTVTKDTYTGTLRVKSDFERIKRARDGDRVRLKLTGGGEQDAYVLSVNEEEGVLFLANKYGEEINGILPQYVEEIWLYEGGENEITLNKTDTGYELYLSNERIFFENTDTSPDISFIKWKPVECAYVSPMLDLSAGDMTKTLYRIGISTSSKRSSNIMFGYETRKSVMSNADGIEGLDLTDFDFDKLSFDVPFAKSFEKRVFERNFNYITFKVSSKENEDCAIREIYGVYTVNNNIKGVR